MSVKALVGVDVAGNYRVAVDLLQKLEIAFDEVILVNAVEPILPDGTYPEYAGPEVSAELFRDVEEAGKTALDTASQLFYGRRSNRLEVGDPLHAILDVADSEAVDLIAVMTERKGALEAWIIGSVTRGLLTASTHSFLAAKPSFRADGPLTAIFATDHSAYAEKCLDKLIDFAPKGIGRIIVTTVINGKMQHDLANSHDPEFSTTPELWAEDRFVRENLIICEKLRSIATECSEEVVRGDVNKALRELMHRENADLLILGAHGHGYLDRIRSGSVSFHQTVAEDYSVWVLRI